jgi:hypothetical protein
MSTKLLKVRSVFKFLFVLVILIFSLSELYQVVVTQAKNILVSKLSQLTSQKVSIESLAYRLPATVQIKNLEIGGRKDQKYFSIDQASVSMAPFASLRKRQLVLTQIQIIGPSLFYEIDEAPKGSASAVAPATAPASDPSAAPVAALASAKSKACPVPQKIKISNGSVEFIDRHLAVNKLTFALSHLNVSASLKDRNGSARVLKFSGKAVLLQGENSPKGQVRIYGWTDLDSRVTRARLEIKNIDAIYLYPYYSKWFNLEKARLRKAQLDFSADITGAGNKLDAGCRLELTQSEFEPPARGQSPDQSQKLAMLAVEIFKALDKGRVLVDFNLKYDADKPGLDLKPLFVAFSEKIKNGFSVRPGDVTNALKLPEHLIKNIAATLGGITKAIFGQTEGLGQEFQQSFQDTFIKVTPK